MVRQLSLAFRTRGGRRRGAGRPPNGATPGVSHLRRPAHNRRHPVHVTLRVKRGLTSLRGPRVFAEVRGALAAGREQFGFRLVHFSVQDNHLHLLAEANDRRALSRGLQSLSIRVAKASNRAFGRKGKVFSDRYHARALKTPREVRFALRYVLLNRAKHERSWSKIAKGLVDPCSSAPWFQGFSRPAELVFGATRARTEWAKQSGSADPPVVSPKSWLLQVGYRRAGPLDVDGEPS